MAQADSLSLFDHDFDDWADKAARKCLERAAHVGETAEEVATHAVAWKARIKAQHPSPGSESSIRPR